MPYRDRTPYLEARCQELEHLVNELRHERLLDMVLVAQRALLAVAGACLITGLAAWVMMGVW